MKNLENLRLYSHSAIEEFQRCPRRYWFTRVVKWYPDTEMEPALVFGSCWHAAMDALWSAIASGYTRAEIIQFSYEAFKEQWISEGMPVEPTVEQARELRGRSLANAMNMLIGYLDRNYPRISEMELVMTERPFAVPLDPNDPDLFYVGKIDKVLRPKSDTIRGVEHKTTSAYRKDGKFRGEFIDSFSPNQQIDGYNYALHLLFPDARRYDVWVDAALVHPTDEGYVFIPIEKQMEQLDAWLWETHYWIGKIETELEREKDVSPDDAAMRAFPKETRSCWDFHSRCPYMDFCAGIANPKKLPNPPPGYKIDETTTLEHIGVPPELLEEGES